MRQESFDLIVIGDEPSGLWLLGELARTSKKARLAWVGFKKEQKNWYLPKAVAKFYSLSSKPTKPCELLTHDQSWVWSRPWLEKKFPALKRDKKKSISYKELNRLLDKHPELEFLAMGVWKAFGRLAQMPSATMLDRALGLVDPCVWNAQSSLEKSVQLKEIEISELKILPHDESGGFDVQNGVERWLAKNVVFNCTFHELAKICKVNPAMTKYFPYSDEILHTNAHFSFSMYFAKEELSKAVPNVFSFLEHVDFIEYETEIFPVYRNESPASSELEFLISAKADGHLEQIQEQAKKAVKQMQRYLPHLWNQISHTSWALGAEDEQRPETLQGLLENKTELYARCLLSTQTRHSRIFSLLPFIHADMIYPLGTLKAAALIKPWLIKSLKLNKHPKSDRLAKSARL